MHKLAFLLAASSLVISGCTSIKSLNSKLGTTKNPYPTLSNPASGKSRSKVNPFVLKNYEVLLDGASKPRTDDVGSKEMKPYLDAGFALTDYYCESFFRDADESQRRRRFGRALTNDTGTVISTILGLANAGQNVVTGVAAGFGLGDNIWRNYDDAFVVTPDLANIQSLVMAAQDNFRQKTMNTDADLPKNYGKAQSIILRYANLCSTLGMKALLSQASDEQRTDLQKKTMAATNPPAAAPEGGATEPPAAPAVSPNQPETEPRAAPQAIPG